MYFYMATGTGIVWAEWRAFVDKSKFKTSDSYFLIMDFLELKITLPDPGKVTSLVVDLHRKGSFPTGKFSFQIPTCHGKNLQLNKRTSGWTECFSALMDAFYEEDMKANGSWPEYERNVGTLRLKVAVPQLLDALQSNRRHIKPCLVVRDLWEENAGINLETGNITLLDASCRYARN
ncbi:hypothetical protein K4K51_009133 [Colletotrichum sp. SAR 10_75]|nr:hypothetical protein K4K51_009133 [Colletotrichum sp. SAR 10_75]